MLSDAEYSKIIVKPTALLKGKACFAQIHDVTMIISDIPKWNDALVLQYLAKCQRWVIVFRTCQCGNFLWRCI